MNVLPGVAAIPGREAEFRSALMRALAYAEAAGCRQLHCLAGRTDDPRAETTFVENLKWASETARPAGVRLLIEPLNTQDNPGYFLTSTAQALAILDQVGRDNVLLQYDCYHMQIMEGGLAGTVKANIGVIDHLQIAGVPGRHEPDHTQEIDYPVAPRADRRPGLPGLGRLRVPPASRYAGGPLLGTPVRHPRPPRVARRLHLHCQSSNRSRLASSGRTARATFRKVSTCVPGSTWPPVAFSWSASVMCGCSRPSMT